MKRDKFLTVMAVLDDRAQYVLGALQNKLTDVGLVGSHTTDVPFHVSLGSFPVSEQMRLTKKLRQTASVCKPFTLELSRYADFDKKVLYLQPLYSDEIYGLHKLFDANFSDGMPFVPHVTMFCGDEKSVESAESVLGRLAQPFAVTVTSLLIGEFFPTKLLANFPLIG